MEEELVLRIIVAVEVAQSRNHLVKVIRMIAVGSGGPGVDSSIHLGDLVHDEVVVQLRCQLKNKKGQLGRMM